MGRREKGRQRGAVVAEQIENNPTDQRVKWIHADPLTGSKSEVFKDGAATSGYRTEYEPLGQEIQPLEPIDPPISLTNETGRYSASDAEWLCRYPDKEESMMPIACQRAANESLEWWFEIKESTPQKIIIDSPLPDYIQPYSPSDEMLAYALASSSKKDKDKKGKTIKGGHLATVQSEKAKDSMIDMSNISEDFQDASEDEYNAAFRSLLPSAIPTDGDMGTLANWLLGQLNANPNCILNMVNVNGGSATRIARDYSPFGHNGRHVVSPINVSRDSHSSESGGNVIPTPNMRDGRVIRWGAGDNLIYYADILISTGHVIRLMDLISVSPSIRNSLKRGVTNMNSKVKVPTVIGFISTNGIGKLSGDLGAGLHVTLVRPGMYKDWLVEHARGAGGSGAERAKMLMDPLDTASPISCPQFYGEIYSLGGR